MEFKYSTEVSERNLLRYAHTKSYRTAIKRFPPLSVLLRHGGAVIMVFCYKIITDSPRRSHCVSPRKCSPIGRMPVDQNAGSDLIASYDYVTNVGDIYDSIPERDWRLLAALARKREEKQERERLAEQFHKMWLKEKEEREMVEAEISQQYKQYLHKKRSKERNYYEHQRLLRTAEQRAKTGQLVDCIRYKEQRSSDLLAWRDDRKITQLIGKAVEEEARAQLAAERRYRRGVEEEWRKQIELVHTLKRADDAGNRRDAILRNASQRLAIQNALTSWETSLVRQEVAAAEATRRARCAAHNALKDARTIHLTRAKNERRQRARRLAAMTAQMRDAVRGADSVF